MSWAADTDVATFRSRLRAFLADHHPGPAPREPAARLAHARAWAGLLVDHGWAAPAWPRRWGGMELPAALQVAYHEELASARVPAHPSPTSFIVAPTLIVHGDDRQRERYLGPLLRAEELWCQGFSEPGAGSDLPALSTRAERDGDHYVVTGQKVWTTNAAIADLMFALVRTGPPGSRHDGISYLLIDMGAPGVEVRPLRDLTGAAHFSEVFFDRVRVPVEQRVGSEGGGWAIARTSLGHERATAFVAGQLKYRRVVDELHALARTLERAGDPVLRQRLVDAEVGVRTVGWNAERVLAEVLRTGAPGPAGSINRLLLATFEQRLHELALDVTGAAGMLDATDPSAPERGRWAWGFLRTRASTIGAGTVEVQRTTVAEQALGLPRGPEPS